MRVDYSQSLKENRTMRVSPHYVPPYRRHRSSGQGIVLIDGRTHYLGKYGLKASKDAYDTLIAEWLASGRRAPDDHGLSVNEVLLAFVHHATKYYKRADGSNPELWQLRARVPNRQEALRHNGRERLRSPAVVHHP
jgi:hypothetical protein